MLLHWRWQQQPVCFQELALPPLLPKHGMVLLLLLLLPPAQTQRLHACTAHAAWHHYIARGDHDL
jgi:hypothetical protein